jgi:hypothetical protein
MFIIANISFNPSFILQVFSVLLCSEITFVSLRQSPSRASTKFSRLVRNSWLALNAVGLIGPLRNTASQYFWALSKVAVNIELPSVCPMISTGAAVLAFPEWQ